VAPDDDGKGQFITLGDKPVEKFAIGTIAGIVGGLHFSQVLKQITEWCFGHVPVPPTVVLPY